MHEDGKRGWTKQRKEKESITALGERDGRREKKEVKEMSNRERKMERFTGRFRGELLWVLFTQKILYLTNFEISMSSDSYVC